MNDPQANRIDPVGAPRRAEGRDQIFNRRLIDESLLRAGIDLSQCGLEELWGVINLLERELGVEFLRMDFGVPGLRPSIIALTAQAAALTNSVIPSQYPPPDGIPQLKGAASQFLNKFLAVEAPPECILPTCGATQGAFIAQAVAATRRENMNEILFLEPGYPPMKAQARFLGIKSIGIDLYDRRGDQLIDAIESIVREKGSIGAISWSNPNNPTWNVLTEEELRGIARICIGWDIVAIEDAAYFGMGTWTEADRPSKTVAQFTDNYFLLLSASKMLSYAGERIGLLATSQQMMRRRYDGLEPTFGTKEVGAALKRAIFNLTAGAPHSAQYAVAALLEAINAGEYDLERSLATYSQMAKQIKRVLIDNGFYLIYESAERSTSGDGFYLTFGYPGFDAMRLLKELLYYGVTALPLQLFGSSRSDGLRGCVALIDQQNLRVLAERITRFRRDH
jgi:aspartate/methionine/tyrosine aminotransferase